MLTLMARNGAEILAVGSLNQGLIEKSRPLRSEYDWHDFSSIAGDDRLPGTAALLAMGSGLDSGAP
jgi:hypothetical protein